MSGYEVYERDEEPISEEEEAYGRRFAAELAVGGPEPDDSHLDPVRAAKIRAAILEAWRAKVRRITYQRRRP